MKDITASDILSIYHDCRHIFHRDKLKNLMIEVNNINYGIISLRHYGEPKLIKPKILKGNNGFPVMFNDKCTNRIFIVDNHLYIKSKDYFSTGFEPTNINDIGKPLSYIADKYFDIKAREKFIYADSWGSVVLRNEAYVVFYNLLDYINIIPQWQLVNVLIDKIIHYHKFEDYSLGYNWSNMIEQSISIIQKYV